MTVVANPPTCPSRKSTYAPWSFGEIYQCIECGHRMRQSHQLLSISPGRPDYDSIYPIAEHVRKSADALLGVRRG